ncbi:unnamed protein product, partial [Ranitomeya imitator]
DNNCMTGNSSLFTGSLSRPGLYVLLSLQVYGRQDGNQGKHRVTKRGPALSYPMFTLVTSIVGRWRAVCVTALQQPNSDAAAIRIVVGIAAASLSVTEWEAPSYINLHLLMLAFGLGAAFVAEFYVFMVLRCFVGIAMAGILINNVVLVAEWVGPSQRAYATITGHVCFAIGLMVLAGIGYAIRNWRLLQIACAAPTALLVFYIWFLPESPRWLLTKGKNEKAKDLLQKAARMNKRELPEHILKQLKEEKKAKSSNMIDLFRNPTLRKRTLIMCLVWFANSLVYYGLSLNVGSFGLNIYLTQLIFGAVEIPARIGSMFTAQFFGRRLSQSLFLLLGGTACLIITAIPKRGRRHGLVSMGGLQQCCGGGRGAGMMRRSERYGVSRVPFKGEVTQRRSIQELSVGITVLAVIGKFATASSYSICYIYAAELFPTIIRQNGVGLCSMTARLAGIIAPLISLLDKYHPAIPMAIYGSGPIIGGLFCFLLPETLGKNLQDHTFEVNNIPRSDSLPKDNLSNSHTLNGESEEKKSTQL